MDDPTLSCLNHECGSFVQTSDKIVVGAEIVGEAGSFHFFQISKTVSSWQIVHMYKHLLSSLVVEIPIALILCTREHKSMKQTGGCFMSMRQLAIGPMSPYTMVRTVCKTMRLIHHGEGN